jgi:hypothetical protein
VYARELVELADADGTPLLSEDGEHVQFEVRPAPGLRYELMEANRMPVDRAKELMRRYGRCVACGHKVWVESTLEAAMGATCRRYFA